MSIVLTIKEKRELVRLRRCLSSGSILVNDIQAFLDGLQRKVDSDPSSELAGAVPERKRRRPKKFERKEKYRLKILTIGNKNRVA